MDLNDLLESIPDVKKSDLLESKINLEDIEKLHPSLTYDNPLTYFVYLDRRKDLSIDERNTCFKIIEKLKQNNKNKHEAIIEKHNMESPIPMNVYAEK